MTCTECGRPIAYAGRGVHPAQCGPACRQKAWRRARVARLATEALELLTTSDEEAAISALSALPGRTLATLHRALERGSGAKVATRSE